MRASRIGQILVETYRIDRLIAEGGMGAVYEAGHLRLPKRFAVKFLNLNLVGNAEAQVRFRREAEIIAALDHTNIVSLLDYNVTEEGVPFIVMEFLDGEHLGKRISRAKLPLAEALRILAPVVSALSAAHARGIVHRDLKPENIVLVKNGEQVKVVDFGIAKIRDGQELTASNTILGTVPYMAPEQLFGTSVDARTDEFALSSILYEMLSGEMAFGSNGSVPGIAARVAHHQPPFLAGIPHAVNEAMLQGMAKAPEARFPSVKEFLAALQAAATRPDEPAVVVEDLGDFGGDAGLPELAGEATAISLAPAAPPSNRERAGLADDTGSHRPAPPAVDPDATEKRLAAPTTQPLPPDSAFEDSSRRYAPMESLSTVQLDKGSLLPPAPNPVRETAQVPMPQLSPTVSMPTIGRIKDQVTAQTNIDDVPMLRPSARRVWLVLVVALVVGGGVLAWLYFTQKPPY